MKVLVAQVFQETNCFNPIRTELSDFSLMEGEEIRVEMTDRGTILGGILTECGVQGLEVLPAIAAMAPSGGPVSDAAFELFSRKIMQAATRGGFDFIALDLHGAMMTESVSDPEGEILTRLRNTVGQETLIGVGLDLHAHLTERMIKEADVLVPCKKNPHSDLRETGSEVVRLLLRSHEAGRKPQKTFLRVPMLLQGNTETHAGPLAEAHRSLVAWKAEHDTALDASLCNCQPFLDAENMGQVLLLSELEDSGTAESLACEVGLRLWRRRDEFVNRFPPLEQVLERVRTDAARRPFVVSDYGDRTNAGAPGDSTVVLRSLLERFSDIKAAVPLTDPWAVEAAARAGVGAPVSLALGARFTIGLFEPCRFSGTVKRISDGRFRMKGPMMAGQIADCGKTVVLEKQNLSLVITSRPARTQDTGFYESLGLKVAEFDAVFVKSGNHFQLSYDGVATPLKAATPGLGAYCADRMPPVSRPPLFPERNAPTFTPRPRIIPGRPLAPAVASEPIALSS